MATVETDRPIDLAQLALEIGVPASATAERADLELAGVKRITADMDAGVLAAAIAAHVPSGRRARRRTAMRDAVRTIAARADTPESWAALTAAERSETTRLAVRAIVAILVELYSDAG